MQGDAFFDIGLSLLKRPQGEFHDLNRGWGVSFFANVSTVPIPEQGADLNGVNIYVLNLAYHPRIDVLLGHPFGLVVHN